jgi:hypothetical protein
MATKAAQIESALSGYLDESGRPLASGKVYTYEAGTTTPKATYQDVNKVTPHANPVILDDQGQKLIYADGLYKLVIKDSDDNIIETRDNLQYFFISSTITTATEISAADSTGITLKDDGGNTGITLKDGGNVGIKSDTNPQTAFGVADSDTTAYASTISVTSVGSDIVRIRNVSASAAWAGIQFEVGSGNVGMTRLITKKDASDETTFYIQLKDSSAASVTKQQLALSSEGDLTIGNSLTIGSMVLNGTSLTLPTISISGTNVVIDSHFEFDGNLLTALTNNNTIITAYTGTNITIESVTFDGGVVAGVTTLTMSSDLTINTNKFTVAGSSGNTVIAGTASITGDVTVNTNKFTVTASSGNTVIAGTADISGITNIGSAGSNAKLNVLSTTEQVRVLYDASNYYTTTVSSLGAVTFNAVGSDTSFNFSDKVVSTAGLTISGGDTIIIAPSGTNNVLIKSASVNSSGLIINNNVSTDAVSLINFYNAPMIFGINNTEYVRITGGNVGIGTGSTVSAKLHSLSTTEQLRLGYDASNYLSTTVSSSGLVTLAATGSGAKFSFSNNVGIGTTSPDSGIHVEGTTDATSTIKVRGYSGVNGKIKLQTGGSIFYIEALDSAAGANFVQDGVGTRAKFDGSGNFGVGTSSTVSARLHSLSTTEQLRLGYDASNYLSVTVSSTGGTTFECVGSGAAITISDTLTVTNQHKVFVYSPSAAFIADNTSTPINWDSERYDTGGLHSTSSYKARITIVESGTYLFIASITFNPNATGYRSMSIWSSGGTGLLAQKFIPGSSATYGVLHLSVVQPMTAGEYAYVQVYQNSGGSLSLITNDENSFFSAIKIC